MVWVLLAILAAGITACGGPTIVSEAQLDDVHFVAGEKQQVRGEPITLLVPKPFERAADHGWVAKLNGTPFALLRVDVLRPLPEQGMDAILNQRVRAIRKAGVAGVLRDERVQLGDLDGRLIEAVELVGDRREALLLVATETEDGLVTATLALPATMLKREGDVLRAALRSLRVAVPSQR